MTHFLVLAILHWSSAGEYNLRRIATVENAILVNAVAMNESHFAILTRKPPFIQILNRDFVPLFQWGKKGQGPGELTHPEAVCLRGSEVWVLNKLPNRICIYSIEGEFLRSVSLDQSAFVIDMKATENLVVVQDGGLFKNPNKLFSIEDGKSRFLDLLDLGEVVTLQPSSGPPLSLKAPYSQREFWDLKAPDILVTYAPEKGITLRNSNLDVMESWHPPKKAFLVPEGARNLWLEKYFVASSSLPSSGWRREAEKVKMPQTFAQVLQLFIDGDQVWLLRAYKQEGQLWESYENRHLVGIAEVPFSAEVHLIHDGLVVLSDPEQETPLNIFALERKDL